MDDAERPSLQSAVAKLRSPWTITAWVLLALGGIGILGWVFSIPALVQPVTSRPPIRPAAAIGLLALGVGALALDRGRRRLAFGGATVAILIGFAALLDLATGLSLGPGSLPFGPSLASRLTLPASQGLPLSTAWGLLLGGVGLAAAAERLRTAAATFAVGVFGSTLVALSIALLLTQSFGFSPGVQFGPVVGSGPQVAIGLLALGVGLASSAWTRDWTPTSYPAWIPLAAGLASLTAVLFLWRAVIQGQRDDNSALLAAAARKVSVAQTSPCVASPRYLPAPRSARRPGRIRSRGSSRRSPVWSRWRGSPATGRGSRWSPRRPIPSFCTRSWVSRPSRSGFRGSRRRIRCGTSRWRTQPRRWPSPYHAAISWPVTGSSSGWFAWISC